MKRLLPILLLVILLLLLNACGNYPILGPSPNDTTAVIASLTATMWTITVSPTSVPKQAKIVEWLNEELSSVDSALEQTLDAKYQVVDVSFPVSSNGLAESIRVDIRCECTNGQCCYPERMFVAAVEAMKKRQDKIIDQVPATVTKMKVVCYDHTNQFGIMSASWSDVKSYLQAQINGYQFGARVIRGDAP